MSTDFDGGTRPRREPSVAWRVIDGEAVMVLPSSAKVHTLNRVGSRFWEMVDGERTICQIARTLADEFDAEIEQIERDCLAFVEDLTARGVLVA